MIRNEFLARDNAYPLDGKRVLDVTGSIGAYCTKLLADLGADVIKVEQPEGDPMRGRPPFAGGDDAAGYSAVFASYHANKRSVTLDTRRDEAIPMLESLGAACDVVIVSPTRRTPVAGFDRATPRCTISSERVSPPASFRIWKTSGEISRCERETCPSRSRSRTWDLSPIPVRRSWRRAAPSSRQNEPHGFGCRPAVNALRK